MIGLPAKTYEQIVFRVRWQIETQLAAGHEYARLAQVGISILNEHVPVTRSIGDPCPRCIEQYFPCKILRDYAFHIL